MFERMANGILLAKQSARVLMSDKELLVFPLLSSISCLLVLATFAIPLTLADVFKEVVQSEEGPTQIQSILLGLVAFFYYFCNFFVIVFFNSALVSCAIIRLKGGDPNLRDGFSAAMARLPQILMWAFVAATVGLLLKMIESSSERFGSIVSSLVGMAWSITTYFVVPILVVESLGPIGAVKRSAGIIRKTWGESLTAHAGIGIVTFLAILPGIGMVVGGVALFSVSWQLAVLVLVLGVLWIWATGLISSAIGTILLGGMYIYAVEGTVPDQFDANVFQRAFTAKKRRSLMG